MVRASGVRLTPPGLAYYATNWPQNGARQRQRLLRGAVDEQIEIQKALVAWWEDSVSPGYGGNRKSNQVPRTAYLKLKDAEKEIKINQQQVSRWRSLATIRLLSFLAQGLVAAPCLPEISIYRPHRVAGLTVR